MPIWKRPKQYQVFTLTIFQNGAESKFDFYFSTARQFSLHNHLTSTSHENYPIRTFLQFFSFSFRRWCNVFKSFSERGKDSVCDLKENPGNSLHPQQKKKANWSFSPSLNSANDKILKWRATLRTTLRSEAKQNWRNNLLGRGFK